MKSMFIKSSMAVLLLIAPWSLAQTPKSAEQEKVLLLIKELQTQQAQMVDNQAKIEAKLADVSEAIRVARIYAARVR
jgi:hypothetical protein